MCIDKESTLRELKAVFKTYHRLNCRTELNTHFENFHYVYGFSEVGFCTKGSVISDQEYFEYTDCRVTNADLCRVIRCLIDGIKIRVRHKMDEEERIRRELEFDTRFEDEIRKDQDPL